jgi:exonuclease SbcC
MTWALWGWARGKRYGQGGASPDELVHQGQTDMEVSLDFLVDSSTYRVVRKYSKGTRGRSNAIILDLQVGTGSGYQSLSEGSAAETERSIQRLLRMDYETFINSAFLLQGQADLFTRNRPAQRKEVLAEILGLSIYERLEGRSKEVTRTHTSRIAALQVERERLGADLGREPEHREALVSVQATLAVLEPRVEELGRRWAELQEQVRELERQGQEALGLAQELSRARQEAETLATQAQEAHRRIEAYRQLQGRQAEIDTGNRSWEEAHGQLEALEAAQLRYSDLAQQRLALQHRMDQERGAIEAEQRHLRQRMDGELLPRSQALPEVEAALEGVAAALVDLQTREVSLQGQRQKLLRDSAQTQALETDNKRLRGEMDDLRGRLDLLVASDAACPLCGTPLGADGRAHLEREIEAEGKRRADTFRTNQRALTEIEERHAALEPLLKKEEEEAAQEGTRLAARQGSLEREREESRQAGELLAAAQEQAVGLATRLETEAFAQDTRQALATIEAELAATAYDPDQHQGLRARAQELEGYRDLARRLLEAAERLPQEERAALELGALQEARSRDADEAQARLTATEQALKGLPDLQVQAGQQEPEHLRLGVQRSQLQQEASLHTARLEELDRAKIRLASVEAEVAGAEQGRDTYDLLAEAFGKRGVQALLIEAAIPELEEEANALLGRLTDNRMSLTLETQRQSRGGGMTETLEIRIADELGTRSYELFSGGEAFRINFALRIALAKLLASRAGAPLRSLFLDEGFGTQDAQGRERLVEAIHSIQKDFDLILVITHIDELKEAFPLRVEVTKTEEAGSTFELVWS